VRIVDFQALVAKIGQFDTSDGKYPGHYLDRILSLIDACPEDWQRLYATLQEAELAYCPFHVGVPREILDDDDLVDADKSIVEIFVEHLDELSGSKWFDCDASVWLGILAADQLGNGLLRHEVLQKAVHESEHLVNPEIAERLPLQIPLAYWHCSEALIAGEVARAEMAKDQTKRVESASRGGQARNKKYAHARAAFLAFYIENTHLSRAEAARRFYKRLNENLRPGEPGLYVNEESAIRAFRDALTLAGI
jgi:hypothetical protein